MINRSILAIGVSVTWFCLVGMTWHSHALGESAESEMQILSDRLERVRVRISTFSNTANAGSQQRQQHLIDRSLDSAKSAQQTGDHVRAIRELQNYLNATQVPETSKYLAAQSILAESYRATGYNSRALRAYRRYLATFITSSSSEYAEALEILRKMSTIAAVELRQERQELSSLLSSVAALKLPDHVMAEALYWGARSLVQIGEMDLAKSWFNRANQMSKDHILKSRSLYFEAMIAIAEKNVDRADQLLSQALVLEKEAGSQEADAIKLALARTAAERGMFKRSQEIYQEIGTDSPVYRDALFDSIYVKIRIGQFADAANLARTYLEKYRESQQSLEVSNLLGYLSLHEEKFDSSREHLNQSQQKLTELRTWVRKLLTNPNRVTHEKLLELKMRTSGIAQQSPITETALNQFAMLSEQQQRNADLQSELRNVIVTVGSSRISEINPHWKQTSIALHALVEEIADIGRRISALEGSIFESKLTAADKFRLEELARRRQALISPSNHQRWTIDQYRGWINNQILVNRAQRIFSRAFDLNLQLKSADYASSIRGGQGMTSEDLRAKTQLQNILSSSMESIGRFANNLQQKNIADFVAQSDHQSVRRMLTRYSNLLLEEESLLTKYRDQSIDLPNRFRAQSFSDAWSQWKLASKATYEVIYRFDQEMQRSITATISSLEDFKKRALQRQSDIATTTNQLEVSLANLSPSVLSHYDRQISRKISRIQKWKGDLESIKFKQMERRGSELNAKLDLEREISRASYESVFERSL